MKVTNSIVPDSWLELFARGWKIKVKNGQPCGGEYAWYRPGTEGSVDELVGCICHDTPSILVVQAMPPPKHAQVDFKHLLNEAKTLIVMLENAPGDKTAWYDSVTDMIKRVDNIINPPRRT